MIRKILSFLFILMLISAGSVIAATSNLTVSGATRYQTMDGVGSNVHAWSWKNGELRPALDALVDTLGHNMFRVVHDRMEWAGTGSTRPATTLANLQNLDPATLQSVYEVPDMQDLWNTIAYLNSKGITGDQITVNFMGWTARWMGGSGAYGSVSKITNNDQTNQDIATMIASLVYYGHHREDISGANQNLSFNYVAPFNEPDWNGLEGPQISASQMNIIYNKIDTTLDAMGDTITKLIGPDTASGPDSYTSALNTTAKTRMTHFSWHSYSGAVSPATARGSIKADWMTETSKWCSGCDSNQPPGESEWSFGSGIGDILLGDIRNGFSTVLTWEGFDTYYYHHNSYSAWGHVGCTQNGNGCTTSDTYPRSYAIRARAWPQAAIAKAVLPGMVMRGVTTSLSRLTVLSFYDDTTGTFSMVGHNTGSSAITINGQLYDLPTVTSLSLYQTNASSGLRYIKDVAVSAGLFTVAIPAGTFFYFINSAPVPDTVSPSVPTNLVATAVSSSQINLSWTASTDNVAVTGYNIYRNGTKVGTSGTNSYSDTGLTASTTYNYKVSAYDAAGNTSAQSTQASATTPAASTTMILGHNTIGATTDSSNANYINATKFTMPNQNGTVTSMSVYVSSPVSASPNNQYQLAIYSNSNGVPGSLIAKSVSGTLTGNAWNTVAVSANLTANTTYWLCYNTNAANSSSNNTKYDAGSSGQTTWRAQTFGTWPTTFGTPAGNSATQSSIYASYTAGGSGDTVYTITASAGTGGSISPSGSVSVIRSGSQSFTITPNAGYTVNSVTVDGASVGAVTSYTFSNVTATHTIAAAFASSTPASNLTIWSSSTVPGTVDTGSDSPVELGVKFRSDVAGYISGIRFYKARANTGTHVGNLWSSTGALLATATFTNETTSGWQQVNFSSPVAITANTVYVASYHTNVGHYSLNGPSFASDGVDSPPLHALANGESGSNGVYSYGSTSSFPHDSYLSSNYWVDVVFSP